MPNATNFAFPESAFTEFPQRSIVPGPSPVIVTVSAKSISIKPKESKAVTTGWVVNWVFCPLITVSGAGAVVNTKVSATTSLVRVSVKPTSKLSSLATNTNCSWSSESALILKLSELSYPGLPNSTTPSCQTPVVSPSSIPLPHFLLIVTS